MACVEYTNISCAIEGPIDEAILYRIGDHLDVSIWPVYGKKGKQYIKKKIQGFNQAAHFHPWIVLVDLDNDFECAPPLVKSWLPTPVSQLCFRVAVRETEAWILADGKRFSKFFSISASKIPVSPDTIPDPKLLLVNIIKQSRKREIREDMAPRPNSGRNVGPAYTSRLIEFIEDKKDGWRPEVAAQFSESLSRCIQSIKRLYGR